MTRSTRLTPLGDTTPQAGARDLGDDLRDVVSLPHPGLEEGRSGHRQQWKLFFVIQVGPAVSTGA